MKWVKERDLLIAQTMAFVQSVTGKKPDFTASPITREAAPIENPPPLPTPAPAAASAEPPVVESTVPTDLTPKHLTQTELPQTVVQTVVVAPTRASPQNDVAGSRAPVITFRTVSVRSGLTAREISTK